MSDPEERKEWERRGREGLGTGEPQDWDAREAYRRGAEERASVEASRKNWNDYASNLFKPSDDDAGRIDLRRSGSGFGFWLLIYFAPLAIFGGAAAQQLMNWLTGNGLFALVAAIVGFVLGYLFVGTAYVRNAAFRRLYGIAFAAVPALAFLWAWITGAAGSPPFWQPPLLIGGVLAIFGLASWLTLRHVQKQTIEQS
ncbi:MAG: hypothetical protein JNM47_05350 [Hyphomonadaceae bacterium]|nr:hypothetical protein [Hyphomonadaceae bacterium]